MLEQKMFNNLPEQEHLQPLGEENNLFSESESSTIQRQKESLKKSINLPSQKIIVVLFIAFFSALLLNIYYWLPYSQEILQYPEIFSFQEGRLLQQRFPKILWIYTQNQRDAEHMEEDIYYNYFAQYAENAKYEVRYVNSLTAYDYLTNHTILNVTNTMNKRTVDETVHSFLKLALLYENGGLMIEPGTLFLDNDFKWIEYMFDVYSQDIQIYKCKPSDSSFYIPKNAGVYNSMILAAVPHSPFIQQLLNFMSQVITSQELKLEHSLSLRYNIKGLTWNNITRVYAFSNIISDCINHLLPMINQQQNQKCFLGMQESNVSLTLAIEHNSLFEQSIHSKRLSTVRAIKGFDTNKVNKIITGLALGKYTPQYIQNTLLHQVLQAPGNRQVFLQKLPEREVQLCLVVMEGLTKEQILYTSTLFQHQSFTNWRLVMPALDIKSVPQFMDYRMIVMEAKSTKVHNIEKAVTNYCPHRGYAVLLNFNETFENRSALYQIAKAAQDRQVVGVYIPLQHNNKTYQVNEKITSFYRFIDGIVNPKFDVMNHIINHLRVFSVQTFKTIPQFALRNWNGKYFRDRLIFLMDFHDLIHRPITQPQQLYTIKKHANLWNIPTKISVLNDIALLKINNFQQIDREQLKLTRTRVSARNIKTILYDLHRYKVPMSKMVAFNPGKDFLPVQQKKGPELIPRIIHQVWLGNQIPPAKQYFIQKTKRIYPGYQIKVWRENNITRELFPTTYDIIQTLLDFNKRSPYNKLATVTDIMRHQILYREGGLWKDAGMNMLRPIPDSFLKYKLVLATDRLYQYRYIQGMCFFGNMPKYQNMLRINNYRNLNRMRIYHNDPFPIAGPVDFRQLLIGQEQFSRQILLLPYETFYPGQVGQHPEGDLCTTKQLKQNEKYEIVQGGWYLRTGCEQKYPYAFALEHNNYGSSWVGAKQLQNL